MREKWKALTKRERLLFAAALVFLALPSSSASANTAKQKDSRVPAASEKLAGLAGVKQTALWCFTASGRFFHARGVLIRKDIKEIPCISALLV